MTAKDYLSQARTLQRAIRTKSRQIEALNKTINTLEDGAVTTPELSAIASELREEGRLFAQKYREIAAVVDAVPNPVYWELLILRYLNNYTWKRTAAEMGYSHGQVHRLHKRALSSVDERACL